MSPVIQAVAVLLVLAIFAGTLTHHRGWWGRGAKGTGKQAMNADVKRAKAKAKTAKARANTKAKAAQARAKAAASKARAKTTTPKEPDVSTANGPGLFARLAHRVMFAGATPPTRVTNPAAPPAATVAPTATGPKATVTPIRRPAAAPRPRPASPPATTAGRTPPMASTSPATGAAADLFTAANTLIAASLAGDIRAKIMGFKTFNETLEQMGQAFITYGRQLSESGQEYPAMVWEAVIATGTHLLAGAMSMGEADNGATTVANMPFGELAASPINTPHNSQANQA